MTRIRGRGEMRLEEDLERAAAEAGVPFHDRAVERVAGRRVRIAGGGVVAGRVPARVVGGCVTARVVDGCVTARVVDGCVPARLVDRCVGDQAQQQRLAGLHRLERVQPHRGLGADAADEALERAVGEHDRGVAGTDARRPAGADDRRDDERRAVGHEALHAG